MRPILATILCGILFGPVSTAAAQAKPTPAATSAERDKRILLGLEDGWAVGVVKRDRRMFERILAPGFIYSEDDKTMSRKEVLESLLAGSDTVTSAHNEGMEVHLFGSSAVVTGWLILRGRGADGPFDRRYRYTDTWMKRTNGWQIIAAHDYLVPAGRK